jgi:tetratricopeptide (TPR) repeat protein
VAEQGGIFEAVLGGEQGEAGGSEAIVGLDPVAAALAIREGERGRSLDPRLASYLAKQEKLVEIQSEHLHEQRTILLSQLKIRRFTDSLKAAIQLVVVVVLGIVIAGIAAMAWEASQDHSLVVEAFSVPPDLVARGLTGQVVAKQVLDQLSEMQAQTFTARPANSYSNNWGEALKVEIPQTGVSLGEARQYLHSWLGHETHITGEVFETPAGVTVVARVGEDAAKTQAGAPVDLQTLLHKTSEAIYEETQPYRYGKYILLRGESAEARALFTKLASNPSAEERAWAHIGLGNVDRYLGDFYGAVRETRASLAELPDFPIAYGDMAGYEDRLGHDEASRNAYQALVLALNRRPADVAPDQLKTDLVGTRADLMAYVGDFQGAIGTLQTVSAQRARLVRAEFEALNHDPAISATLAGTAEPKDPRQQTISVLIALERGDSAALNVARSWVSSIEGVFTGHKADPAFAHDIALRVAGPYLALAEARFGDPGAASTLAASLPADCYACQWAKGDVAAAKGDRVDADRAFAMAIADAPHLPKAYLERGMAHLGWGDQVGALADAKRANQLGPRYADPLKLWGDILARQGDWRGAKAKYDAALPLAPAWAALKAARAQAAMKVG